MLRQIVVVDCDDVVNLFPINLMPFFHHLEDLEVLRCGSIEVLFNIDLDCVGEIGEEGSSRLRSIRAHELGKLREVWRVKLGENKSGTIPMIPGFQAVEMIKIGSCKRFRDVFTPTTTNFDLPALAHICIQNCGESGRINVLAEGSEEQEEEATLEANATTTSTVVFPSFLMPLKQQSESPMFHNLTTITLDSCNSIKYLFSNRMAKLLSNLKNIDIRICNGIGEVVSNKDCEDEENTTSTSTSTHTSTVMFPHLDSLTLYNLKNLKCIDGGAEVGNNGISFSNTTTTTVVLDRSKISHVGGVSWFLCQHSKEIHIYHCDALPSVIPSYALGQTQKLQVLTIENCQSMKEVFETQWINNNINDVDEGDGGTWAIPRLNNVIVHKLHNLEILEIINCGLLEDVFTFSALINLRQLEKLKIRNCKALKVIVKEEKHDEGEQTTTSSKVVVFPRLNSIELVSLPELMGFFLGMNEFQWPSLDKVTIKDCPQMRVFAPGGSTTPKLKYVQTSLGQHSLECGLNFHVTTSVHRTQFSSLDNTSSCLPTSEGKPYWSFLNLINLDMNDNYIVEKIIIPSSDLLQLQKLQTLNVKSCHLVEEVFGALEGTDSGFDESETTTLVKLPKLTQLDLKHLYCLRYIWRSNRWTVFECPNLTKLSIHYCNKLEHVFVSSMVGSLLKLQELRISYCESMKVIVKDTNVVEEEEEKSDHGIMNGIKLPHLRSLELVGMPSLEGFCLGKEDFSFPSLDTLKIEKCPTITTFTMGNSATPKLEEVETSFGFYDVKEDNLNTFIKTKQEEFKERD